jgi:MoxR-like ATPase
MTLPTDLKVKHPLFLGDGHVRPEPVFPDAPPWRRFTQTAWQDRGRNHVASDNERVAVNLALHLHRPVLITGKPGSGKTSLAYAVAYELGLGRPFEWAINSRSSLIQGLYHYDAVGRLRDANLHQNRSGTDENIGEFIRLGPLGAALRTSAAKPTVLLIDEIDKSDVDLPNDLLHVFEEGRFEITELSRIANRHPRVKVGMPNGLEDAEVLNGIVECARFPLVLMTSNGEREFPPAFLRRCIRLGIDAPDATALRTIVHKRLPQQSLDDTTIDGLIAKYISAGTGDTRRELATDQLLNALLLAERGVLAPDFDVMTELKVLADLNE